MGLKGSAREGVDAFAMGQSLLADLVEGYFGACGMAEE
jgi:hypothetical protein